MSHQYDREVSARILDQYNRDYYHGQVIGYYRRICKIIGVTEAREWRKANLHAGDSLRILADVIWRKWLSLRNIVIIRESAERMMANEEAHPQPRHS